MSNTTQTVAAKADPTCDPRQHARDEKAFVEMVILCAVLWVAWRGFRYWRERSGLQQFRRRRPGA